MSNWDINSAIAAQHRMIQEDIKSAKEHYHNGNYPEAAKDLAAVIGEMGALSGYESIKDGRVDPK